MTSTPLLEVRGLTHDYGSRRLCFPDFALSSGHMLVLSGPSGSGKSTLLHRLAGVLRPSGQTQWHFAPMTSGSSGARQEGWRPDHVGWLPQRPQLLPGLSLRTNVLLPLAFSQARRADAAKADELLERLGLRMLAEQKGHTLSVGQAARACLARALITAPRLLLADEPSASLDAEAAERVAQVLREYLQAGGAAIIASHDAEWAASCAASTEACSRIELEPVP